jgi:hypothetical protein
VYPDPSTSGSKASQAATRANFDSSSNEDEFETGQEFLEAIIDEDERLVDTNQTHNTSQPKTKRGSTNPSTVVQRSTGRHDSETPSLVQDKGSSPTPSTEGSVGYSGAYQTTGTSRLNKLGASPPSDSDGLRSDWSHLPADLQFYLTYFYENLTHLHYSLKYDSGEFLKTHLLDAALRNDALLHGLVGFAAFQRTVHNAEGRIQDFLQYYNKAVSLLLNSLKKGEKHNLGMLMAILQLATIEVRPNPLDICYETDSPYLGIPWRLDQPTRPSKSCL